eukprot:Skav224587  [mRNA]  locus=scaffold2684:26249:27754:- [translate_table: standard]
MNFQIDFLKKLLNLHVEREKELKARLAAEQEAFQALQARLEETTALAEQAIIKHPFPQSVGLAEGKVPRLEKLMADAEAQTRSELEVDSVNDIGAFGKDEAAREPLLTSHCKAEYEVIPEAAKPEEFNISTDSDDEVEADDIFTSLLELCKQDLERPLPGRPTSGTKSPGKNLNFERHDMEDDLEEEHGSSAPSSPEEGSDRKSLQTDFLGEEVADEMVVPQIEHRDQVVQVVQQDGFLPQELWPRLLEFLPVDEVMKMQTRAVSHFFSDSKAWVAHLVKLMDLDALPTDHRSHSKHPVCGWMKYFGAGDFETVMEMKRDAPEGFQGYRIWFDGLHIWHAICPELTLHCVEVIMQHYRSFAPGRLSFCLWSTLMASGVRQLRLPITKGLLSVLCSKDLELGLCKDALRALDSCRSVFHHLSPNCAAELLESATSWKDEELRLFGLKQVCYIMEMMSDDRDFCSATHYMERMQFAHRCGRMDAAAANKQKVLDLLMESKECS